MPSLFRHIAACNNAVLPGGRTRLLLDGQHIGWVQPDLVPDLVRHGAVLDGDLATMEADRLQPAAKAMAQAGRFRFRGEAFDVRAVPDGPVLAQLDRGALPALGVAAAGVHLNGLVRRTDGDWLWVGRRAAHKLLDPGKLDHIVAGGIPAGMTPRETLAKEADEEATIPPALTAAAQHTATLSYAMDRPEGLRRDRLFCYDVLLPESFQPRPQDGEVEAFELWPLPAVLEAVRNTDRFKFNVNLVLIDLFLRSGMIHGGEAGALRAALDILA